jgi:TonB family protein
MKKKIFIFFSAFVLLFIFTAFAGAQTGDKKLKIIKKPGVKFSRECRQSSGNTLVRVTFDKSAKITETEITRTSGCKSFDGNALDSARRITFEPATKDGEPITVVKLIEYNFRTY